MNSEMLTLFRPVGLKEAELILQMDAKAFPPRLPHQPIFYPVLNYKYAEKIARDWNTKDAASAYCGFVTTFQVDKTYADQFEVQTVGAAWCQEFWIPAEELETFNSHILGRIEFKAAFYGDEFVGARHHSDKQLTAEMQFVLMQHSLGQDFYGEMVLNRNAILLNYAYWVQHDFSQYMTSELKQIFLRGIAQEWQRRYPDIHLLGSEHIEKL